MKVRTTTFLGNRENPTTRGLELLKKTNPILIGKSLPFSNMSQGNSNISVKTEIVSYEFTKDGSVASQGGQNKKAKKILKFFLKTGSGDGIRVREKFSSLKIKK